MQEEQPQQPHLIDLSDRNNLSGGGGGAPPPQMGFIGYPAMPQLPDMPVPPSTKPFNYPPFGGGGGGGGAGACAAPQPFQSPPPFAYNIPPNQPAPPAVLPAKCAEEKDLNTNFINCESNNTDGSGRPG
uniref:U1 small nuclear ribonucleoprotein C-like n=1 Tax=Drosophila rhopaloa TaxID=1041015 RepID=A0A6P4FCC2_DRORH